MFNDYLCRHPARAVGVVLCIVRPETAGMKMMGKLMDECFPIEIDELYHVESMRPIERIQSFRVFVLGIFPPYHETERQPPAKAEPERHQVVLQQQDKELHFFGALI
jgi:hypothetical protein